MIEIIEILKKDMGIKVGRVISLSIGSSYEDWD
jgi:hypothetical protein